MIQRLKSQIVPYFRNNPLLISYSFLGTIILTVILNNESPGKFWRFLSYAFVLGLSLCLGGDYLFQNSPRLKKNLPIFVAVVFAVGYSLAFYFEDQVTLLSHLLAMTYLLFLLTPQSVRKNEAVGFHWFILVLYALGLSLSISGILLGLLSFLTWVIKELFGIEFLKIFQKSGLAALLVFLPINLFAFLKPDPSKVSSLRYELAGAVEKSLRLLFVPVMLIYIVVLLFYSLKILIDFKLPQGMVSIPISIAYLLFFAINAYLESQGKQDEGLWKFRSWIQYSFVPLFVVMGIGIGTRIQEYGFTVDRAYLLICYFFMLLSMAIRIKYQRLELRKIIGIAAILLLFTSIGPLSPKSLTVRSQTERFLTVLKKYKSSYSRLEDFKFSDWKLSDISSARSALVAISGNNGLPYLEKKAEHSGLIVTGEKGSEVKFAWSDIQTHLTELDRSERFFYGKGKSKSDERVCKSFRVDWSRRPTGKRVTGYDWIFQLDQSDAVSKIIGLPDKSERFDVDLNKQTLFLVRNGEKSELIKFGDALLGHTQKAKAGVVDDPLVLNGEAKGRQVRMIIWSASVDCGVLEIAGDLLVKNL